MSASDPLTDLLDPPHLVDDPCVWAILYEDAERVPEIFQGCGATLAAHARFDAVKQTWNCHLFVPVAKG